MAKKLVVLTTVVVIVVTTACLCLFAVPDANYFRDLVGLKKFPLSLKNSDFLCEKQPIKEFNFANNNRLLLVFDGNLGSSELDIWKQSNYDILIFGYSDVLENAREEDFNSPCIGKYSLCEYFVAAYYDYMQTIAYDNYSIRFLANGFDARLVASCVQYICANAELYPLGILPERITLCDAGVQDDENLAIISSFGIAIEVVASAGNFSSQYATAINLDGKTNTSASVWYTNTLELESELIDARMNNSTEVVPTGNTCLECVLARRGVAYNLCDGGETYEVKDDVFKSQNIDCAVVAGIAYWLQNGTENFKISNRVSNVRVELYLISGAENRLLGACITDKSGFYSIEVAPVYANSFDKLYITFCPPADCEFGTPDISEEFIFPHFRSVKIMNIGVVQYENS